MRFSWFSLASSGPGVRTRAAAGLGLPKPVYKSARVCSGPLVSDRGQLGFLLLGSGLVSAAGPTRTPSFCRPRAGPGLLGGSGSVWDAGLTPVLLCGERSPGPVPKH